MDQAVVRRFLTLDDPVVPMHHPHVLVREAVAQGADEAGLLADTGICRVMLTNYEARISYRRFGMLMANALSLTGNPALGFDFGRSIHLSNLGVLGLLFMSSATFGAALSAALKYYRFLAPAWDLSVEADHRRTVLIARESFPFAPFREFATEALLIAAQGLACQVVPHFMEAVEEVQLPYPEPGHAAAYRRLNLPLRFDSERVQVIMDTRILAQPLKTADPITANWAERQCAAQTSNLPSHNGVIPQVRALLSQSPGQYPDLGSLARILQTSSRSLRRALKAEGTSYLEILDDVRRAQALEYLSATDMSCERIARDLAFSDASSFRRAFLRWTGVGPSKFRSTLRQA